MASNDKVEAVVPPSTSPRRFMELPGEVRNMIYDAVYDEHSRRTGTKVPNRLTPLSPIIFSLKHSPLWNVNPQIRREILSHYGYRSHLAVRLPNDVFMNWLQEWLDMVGDDFCTGLRSLRIYEPSATQTVDITVMFQHGQAIVTANSDQKAWKVGIPIQHKVETMIRLDGLTEFSTFNIMQIVRYVDAMTRLRVEKPAPLASSQSSQQAQPASTPQQPEVPSDRTQASARRLRLALNKASRAITRISSTTLRSHQDEATRISHRMGARYGTVNSNARAWLSARQKT